MSKSKTKLYVPAKTGRKVNLSVIRKDAKEGQDRYAGNVLIGDGGFKTDDAELQKFLDNHQLNGLASGFVEKELKSAPAKAKEPETKEPETKKPETEEEETENSELSEITNINKARLYLIKNHDMSERVSNPETIQEKAAEAKVVFPNFEFPEN